MTAPLARLEACATLADLDALYVEWIGYSAVADDPDATEADLRETLREWIAIQAADAPIRVPR